MRLESRRLIRATIEAWSLGPVDLLDKKDLLELRREISKQFKGRRAGYRYAVWCAEVNLALGVDGDALRGLKGKASRPAVDVRGLSADVLEWLGRVEESAGIPVRRVTAGSGNEDVGELFQKMRNGQINKGGTI